MLILCLQTCVSPVNQAIDVCCRDPNYVDPWPGGMMNKNGNNGGNFNNNNQGFRNGNQGFNNNHNNQGFGQQPQQQQHGSSGGGSRRGGYGK